MSVYYSREHEWIRVEGDTGTVGITAYAAQQLGDVVFVEVPEIGKTVEAHGEIAAVESVKAASEVYSPVSGTVTAVNEELADAPETVNEDPAGAGWFYKMTIADKADLDALMDEKAYEVFCKEL